MLVRSHIFLLKADSGYLISLATIVKNENLKIHIIGCICYIENTFTKSLTLYARLFRTLLSSLRVLCKFLRFYSVFSTCFCYNHCLIFLFSNGCKVFLLVELIITRLLMLNCVLNIEILISCYTYIIKRTTFLYSKQVK